jgi:molybdopterin molybdotransferase
MQGNNPIKYQLSNMISVTEAKKIIRENIFPLSPVLLPLKEAAGLVLAEDVFATTDIPAYPQSSMDGYAFSYEGLKKYKQLTIDGEMAAGSNRSFILGQQQATRIFTGAAVPEGADTVVMQEKTRTDNGKLLVDDENLRVGMNVRPKGSEIKTGSMALEKGNYLSPAAIGFLAGIGIDKIKTYRQPHITIIVTGKELQQPGSSLQYGQVYESNSFALTAVLQQLHNFHIKTVHADDDLEILKNILKEALEQSDMVLLTGGISVGDYDFVLQAATACGIAQLFHKVKQRPGKPLYFGMKGSIPVFGLPGNPSSVLTCFYEYVIPAIEKLTNKPSLLKTINVPLAKSFQKPAGLTHFLKGLFDGHKVMPLDAQESYRLSSFAKANCLVRIEEEMTACEEGQLVEIHLLPV